MEKDRNGGVLQMGAKVETIGQYLKRVREERGISLRAAEEETKIRVRYLKALEEDDFASLPGGVYARGFLRSYARFLGLDADEIVQWYNSLTSQQAEEKKPEVQVTPPSAGRRGLLLFALMLTVVGFVLLGFFLYSYVGRPTGVVPSRDITGNNGITIEERADGEPTEEKETDEGETASSLTFVRDTERLGEYLVANGPIIVEARVEDAPCWIRVVADGRVQEETLQPGTERVYTAQAQLWLKAGNPGSLFLVVNGHVLGWAGREGIPKTFIFNLE